MDIVDTFNHLIPTEHLDDALFLGSNLENEVCEDFSTSQNVLEDSLKNMLSDKDPMLGSASNQFCLPVLDSNDPNFQMPCSTVVGLDDIMDEGVVKESGNDTIDEEELILPNRNLRDKVEDNSVRSPRKSPRLMAQEQVRSLRQSTIAKRSNAAPLNSTKKASVKTVSAPKAGVKQPERCQIKEEACTSPKPEYHKESRRNSRHTGQIEVVPQIEESVSSSHSSVPSCLEMRDEAGLDSKQKCNNQGKANVTSHELNCPLLSETCDSIEEKKSEALECKIKTVSTSLFTFSDKEECEQNDSTSDKMDETIVEEMRAKGKVEQESKETVKLPHDGDQIVEDPASSAALSCDAACSNSNKTEKSLVGVSSSEDEVNECNLEFKKAMEVSDKAKNSFHRNEIESLGYCKDIESNHKQLESTEFSNSNLEVVNTPAFESESTILENAICDAPDQNSKQLTITESIKMDSHETANLEDDRNSPSSSVSCLESKNIKSKHTKLVIHSKQNMTTNTLKKIVAAKHELIHSKTKVSVKSVKRNADESESQQSFHRPVKVRKKQVDKDSKIQSYNSGVKSVKNQVHSISKKTQDQTLVQISKPVAHSLSDKPHGSKEPHHPAQTGHLLHSCQKQCHKPQQLAPAVKTNSHVKEELEHAGGLEHFKDEDKLKLKKPEKNLQPRQRRSSKNFSLDEPPLFIPDNIATIKREGSDHSSSFESKYMWTPSKQCGFCKKPHGNRFMVGCGRCDDWFHGDCVGLSLSQAQQMGEEDKEYVCVKCCAEEDKKTEIVDPDISENQTKVEVQSEDKTMEYEKLGLSKHTPTNDKTKYMDDTVKHKVKILKRESGEGKNSPDCRDSEIKKWQLAPLRRVGQPPLPRRSSEEKSEKIPKESTTVICTGEKASKLGSAHEKQEIKKKKIEKGVCNVHPPTASTSKPSADQIRQSVRHSLKDILMKRLTDSNLKVPEEKAAKVATKIEKELFSFFRDTDAKYKNKYRSLMFNLKDPKNNILFKKVLKGEVTPDHLIRMSPEELASKELAAWRQRENRHTIEMIEKEQREVERRPITKITHKGEIEIESEAPMKEQEAPMEIQEPTANKSLEKIEASEKQKEEIDCMSKDTTSQHRQHLFDLNCKICIGRMAPPVDDLSPKKVKVVVGVSRKHSDNEAESIADALSSTSNILASEFFEEEKQESPKSTFSPAPRPEMPGTVEVESTFLARLNFIWKGFINMPSVAKFVTKAYPVSGSPEYLTEDLPDSIQVGGRISPQTVWDYVEKIKASGTKEICVVRFTPVTEEDQISYTLLFAYFSSRKRYGVAANNMKQVKDMYLIPLGATDKIPHPLVPFDGPGLELHRPNLLLGLIIRQKLKRQHSASASASHTAETPEGGPIALPPEKKSKIEVSTEEAPEEENDFFNSFTTVLHKQRNKPQQTLQEDLPTVMEPLVEVTKQEPPKPLRFLPGVLIGWESQPSTLELANKPLPVDDILQSLLGTTGQVYEQAQAVTEHNTPKEIPFISEQANPKAEKIDTAEVTDGEAKEVKVKVDTLSELTGNSVVGEETPVMASSSISPGPLANLSLRGKPPDVSTEAFLSNLSIQSKQEETVENKERTLKRQLLQDQENNLQDNQTSNTSPPCRSNVGKGNVDGNVSCNENVGNTARSPQFINLKRDPRQAAGRNQQLTASESKDGDSCRNGEKHTLPGVSDKEHLTEQINVEEKLSSVEKNTCVQQGDNSGVAQNSASVENTHTSQTEQAKPIQEDILMQNIETVHPFRRGSPAAASHFEVGNTSQSEFPSKSISFTSRSTSPRTSANFSPMRPQQPNLQHLKSNCPGFPFSGPPNFPPQSMFGFPPHLPPPLLPPPGFGFAQNPMVPWPSVVHLTGQPQRMMGPLSQTSRFIGPQNFYQIKDIRRPERRHSDPWGRQEQQQLDRPFNRGKGDRQRFYSDSHHLKRERHEKEWEQESERHRRRDRIQDKDRDRKSREEGHKDKERARLSHGDRGADGKASRDSRNVDKKSDKPKSEDHEKDKEREKSKHREGEKDRDRYHKDRDHTDRAKSKR
ncbi:PHD finger protein 3 [Rhinolophus ferrumequinum]|uniref:PHD finger protein 3 n=3 Tax=Rhinolophus ferrumequinum TaxID=59479 RepID=A0A671EB16_RHIFE|nr:PHD finger protein 3 isoform X1 [Rhinolophus ferrumequinum]XP_032954076.1 PHD finger protein 3 isoform X1 [Rhinolophus ferrumequinum]KAF6365063.1 PHD finger protein 3 [Rhinolophus ferrumequinum]